MPEQLREHVLGRESKLWSRVWPLLAPQVSSGVPPSRTAALISPRMSPLTGAISLALLLPALAHAAADPLPASVRACAAVTDVLQRLACFDREVARYPAPQAKSAPAGAPAAPTSPTPAPAPQAAAKVVAPPVTSSSNTAGSSAPPAASGAAPTGSGAHAASSADTAAATDSSKHVVAHLVSIERLPGEMILHLDNGQVWQEVQSVSGDLSLKEGDAVTIDKHFGSYWLSGPHVSSMKVHQKS
jgi:hypothetical protein